MLPVGLLYQLTSYLLDGKVPKDIPVEEQQSNYNNRCGDHRTDQLRNPVGASYLRSNNMTETYMEGLNKKIKAVEKNAIVLEFKNAAYVCSAQMQDRKAYMSLSSSVQTSDLFSKSVR